MNLESERQGEEGIQSMLAEHFMPLCVSEKPNSLCYYRDKYPSSSQYLGKGKKNKNPLSIIAVIYYKVSKNAGSQGHIEQEVVPKMVSSPSFKLSPCTR